MFASLAIRNYRLYFASQAVSVGGSWMQNVAIGWATLQLTDSGAALGAITGARYLPILLLGPVGGLIVDRFDKLRLLALTQILCGVLAALLGVLAAFDLLNIVNLFAIVLVTGVIGVVDGPGRQTIINVLVPRESLPNAIALNSIAMNSSRILGPAAGGLLISVLGIAPCFLINAATFVFVIGCLFAMRRDDFEPDHPAPKGRGQIRAGLAHVAANRDLLLPLLLIAVTGTFAWEYPVTLPLITTEVFGGGAGYYGVALASLAIGSLVGGMFAARGRVPGTPALCWVAVVWGATMVGAAFVPSVVLLFVGMLPVGAFAMVFNTYAKTVLQLAASPDMRGRVMALWSMGWQGTTMIGAPLLGYIAEIMGARSGLWIGGALASLAGAVALFAVLPSRPGTSRTAHTAPTEAADAPETPPDRAAH